MDRSVQIYREIIRRGSDELVIFNYCLSIMPIGSLLPAESRIPSCIFLNYQIHGLSAFFVFSEVLHHFEAESDLLHVHLVLFERFDCLFCDTCFLQIIIMHKNIRFISIHYDESIIFCIVKKFQPTIVSLML